jgi:SET domain-containing protein
MLEVRKTRNRGLGVFAKTNLAAGTRVVALVGKSRWIWKIPRWYWEHCFQVDYDRYVMPRPGSAGWSINHSCDPNCWISGERSIVTMRDVKKGEELTFDYSTNVGWNDYSMACECGKRRCRRVIRSYANLDGELKRRYGKQVSPFLLGPPKKLRAATGTP